MHHFFPSIIFCDCWFPSEFGEGKPPMEVWLCDWGSCSFLKEGRGRGGSRQTPLGFLSRRASGGKAWLCSLNSHHVLHKLSTLDRLIRLLFYECTFHFFDLCPCLDVFTLLDHTLFVSWFSIWKGCLNSHFHVLCLYQLPLTGIIYFRISALTICIILWTLLGFRDSLVFFLTYFCFSFHLGYWPDSVHHLISTNTSTNVSSVCQEYDDT